MKHICVAFLFFLIFHKCFADERTYTISMMGVNIGKSKEIWTKTSDPSGKCVLMLDSSSKMGITRGDDSISMTTKTLIAVDCNSFSPISIESENSEPSSKVTSKGIVSNGTFNAEIIKNSNKETFEYLIDKNTTFFSLILKKLSKQDFLKGGKTKVISEESLSEKEISFSGKIDSEGKLNASIIYDGVPITYVISDGIVLSSELQNGLITYTLDGNIPAKKHISDINNVQKKSGSIDLLQNTTIINKGINIKYPRKTKKVTFVFSGENIADIPESCFQKKEKSFNEVTVSIDNSLVFCKNYGKVGDASTNLFEDGDNIEIISVAKKIAEGAPNKDEIIKRTVNFVFRHIKDKNYKHNNLSASEVLKKKAGDCTEHSTLLSALFKSLNIPARMAYGLVLDNEGNLLFHNWNEVLGDNGWISVDSTFGMARADASRIALVYGGSDSDSRERVSLTVLKFINSDISITGFVYEE